MFLLSFVALVGHKKNFRLYIFIRLFIILTMCVIWKTQVISTEDGWRSGPGISCRSGHLNSSVPNKNQSWMCCPLRLTSPSNICTLRNLNRSELVKMIESKVKVILFVEDLYHAREDDICRESGGLAHALQFSEGRLQLLLHVFGHAGLDARLLVTLHEDLDLGHVDLAIVVLLLLGLPGQSLRHQVAHSHVVHDPGLEPLVWHVVGIDRLPLLDQIELVILI